MTFNPTAAQMFVPGTSVFPQDTSVNQVTQAYDCLRANNAGMQFTLAKMTGTISVAVKLQVSDAVIPSGLYAGKFPIAGALGPGAWQPPESSWVDAVDGTGNPVSATITTNTTGILQVYAPFLGRWIRAYWTPATGIGGTLTTEVFVRSPGDY